MHKQLGSSKTIEVRDKPPSPEEQKAELISSYVEKFAAIAGRPVTEDVYALYIEALSDIELRLLDKGLKAYLKRGVAWPWPGVLREYCEEQV